MNPFLATDGYKTDHHRQYPEGTVTVYSNFTPRSSKHAPPGIDKDYVISFGQQMVMRQIKEMFDKHFFLKQSVTESYKRSDNEEIKLFVKKMKDSVCQEIKREYSLYLGTDYDVSHIEALWDLGYLPVKVKALPEGTRVPIGVPVLTIRNTKPEFYWLTNFLETLISNLLWKPMTSATIAHNYKNVLLSWAEKTDKDNKSFVEFQGHDFSMRGMDSVDAAISSGLGHATSFMGSDSLPVISGARKYYNEDGFVVGSVPATEHSVMCAGTKDDEIGTFRRLLEIYKDSPVLSVVSDTWDLWKVVGPGGYLEQLKEEILSRDGKLVIRPDSGDPVDIICGTSKYYTIFDYENVTDGCVKEISNEINPTNNLLYFHPKTSTYYKREVLGSIGFQKYRVKYWKVNVSAEERGVIELLWDIFGGTINEQGYKVLDPHIGAIYGDSITLERANEICRRLEAKGFASTNVVLGVGSFTYQYNTRDTFGFAMKATYVEVKRSGIDPIRGNEVSVIEGREIFKDPITDDGTKKSAKGLLHVEHTGDKGYIIRDQVSWNTESCGALKTIFQDGVLYNEVSLSHIRKRLNGYKRV